MTELPGCCGVVVSYFSTVAVEHQKKGLGKMLLQVRMAAARRKGYGSMVATVVESNTVERKLLTEAGWVKVGEFRNPKTGHIVQHYQVNL